MSKLTSKQRKLVYLGGIVILLIPIIWLGSPPSPDEEGGQIAQMRDHYNLSHDSLGKVSPSSAIMKVVLLGFRGVAADLLWVQANEHQKKKEWGKYRATAESILMLQPNFEMVWRFTGWNLSYNVSAEWDAVEDRYYWVKEGGKFLQGGALQNQTSAEIQYEIGRVKGQKVGRSDEWEHFRKFFVSDPDPAFEGKTDPDFNPGGFDDNYLAAEQEFIKANEIEEVHHQNMMKQVIFRHYPYRSRMDYAMTRQREGKFDEKTRAAWEDSFNKWTQEFGKHVFGTKDGIFYSMEMSNEEMEQKAAESNITLSNYKNLILTNQNHIQYSYWRTRADAEKYEETKEAHKNIYEGKEAFQEADMETAKAKLYKGMEQFEKLLNKYPTFRTDDTMMSEGLEAVLYWNYIWDTHSQARNKPAKYPMQDIWERSRDKATELTDKFKYENGL